MWHKDYATAVGDTAKAYFFCRFDFEIACQFLTNFDFAAALLPQHGANFGPLCLHKSAHATVASLPVTANRSNKHQKNKMSRDLASIVGACLLSSDF